MHFNNGHPMLVLRKETTLVRTLEHIKIYPFQKHLVAYTKYERTSGWRSLTVRSWNKEGKHLE